jgi:hypothetical protein
MTSIRMNIRSRAIEGAKRRRASRRSTNCSNATRGSGCIAAGRTARTTPQWHLRHSSFAGGSEPRATGCETARDAVNADTKERRCSHPVAMRLARSGRFRPCERPSSPHAGAFERDCGKLTSAVGLPPVRFLPSPAPRELAELSRPALFRRRCTRLPTTCSTLRSAGGSPSLRLCRSTAPHSCRCRRLGRIWPRPEPTKSSDASALPRSMPPDHPIRNRTEPRLKTQLWSVAKLYPSSRALSRIKSYSCGKIFSANSGRFNHRPTNWYQMACATPAWRA